MSLIYRQEGSTQPEGQPPVQNQQGQTPLRQFISAIGEGNPQKIVDLKDQYKINIPIDFADLSKPSAKVAELIVAYELFKAGELTEQDWSDYKTKQWVGRKLESRSNKFASTNYRAADGTSLKFITDGPDSGQYWDVGAQTVVSKEANPEKFPVRPVSSGQVDTKAANAAYESAENAHTGMRKLDALASKIAGTNTSAEGWWGSVTEFVKAGLGIQGGVSVWKTELRGFLMSEVVNNLPPGVASDKDIELARSGFPRENWDKDALLSWLAGYRKQMMYTEAYATAKGEFITETGSQSGFREDWAKSEANKAVQDEIKNFSFTDGPSGGDASAPTITTKAEYDALPSGATYYDGNANPPSGPWVKQ